MDNNGFKPYISADEVTSEITPSSVIIGIIVAVVFGAANAYLGLRVGMTVSASIPAAVVAMGAMRVILRRSSVLESNIVQTVGSAGESLAAGVIFTLPVLFLWAAEGKADKPSVLEIMLIALLGGFLGVFFMVPLRKALIVKEHGTLPYPEGSACAEVLLAGEKSSSDASVVFSGMGLAALFTFIIDGLKIVSGEINLRIKGYAAEIGTQIYPAVLSVGYICGPRIASYMFGGGVLGWLVLIPMIVLFGSDLTLYPGEQTVGEMFAVGGASSIWSTYLRYIGAGALASGGIISLIKSLPIIAATFGASVRTMTSGAKKSDVRTERDIGIRTVLSAIAVLTLAVWLLPVIPISLLGAVIVVVFSFFFATVSSRMVGLVGSSNNPVSGMAIATLLIATVILKLTGATGIEGMQSAIAIGSIICIVAAVSGDTSQDLKTGYILGATPRKQQIGELIGITAASAAIGAVLYLLDGAWGFGSPQLGAPQATLMKLITEGVMQGNLPWSLVFIGVFIAVVAEVTAVPVLPFAIGVYLPVQLSACIMAGGLIRGAIERFGGKNKKAAVNDGVLFCSGMIAGEGLVGVVMAALAVFGADTAFDMSGLAFLQTSREAATAVMFGIIILTVLKFSVWRNKSN